MHYVDDVYTDWRKKKLFTLLFQLNRVFFELPNLSPPHTATRALTQGRTEGCRTDEGIKQHINRLAQCLLATLSKLTYWRPSLVFFLWLVTGQRQRKTQTNLYTVKDAVVRGRVTAIPWKQRTCFLFFCFLWFWALMHLICSGLLLHCRKWEGKHKNKILNSQTDVKTNRADSTHPGLKKLWRLVASVLSF